MKILAIDDRPEEREKAKKAIEEAGREQMTTECLPEMEIILNPFGKEPKKCRLYLREFDRKNEILTDRIWKRIVDEIGFENLADTTIVWHDFVENIDNIPPEWRSRNIVFATPLRPREVFGRWMYDLAYYFFWDWGKWNESQKSLSDLREKDMILCVAKET